MKKISSEQIKHVKKTIFLLLKYLSVYKIKMIAVLVLVMVSTIFSVVSPRILAKAINELFNGVVNSISVGNINIDIMYIIYILCWLLGIYIISSLCSYFQGFIMADISADMTYRLRKEMTEKIDKLPLKYFDGVSNGEVLSRITNDATTITMWLSRVLTSVITSLISIIGIIFMMYTINWICATVAVVILPITYFIVKYVVAYSQKFFDKKQKVLGDVNGYIEEIFTQHDIVRVFNAEKESVKTFKNINQDLYDADWKSSIFSCISTPIVYLMENLGYIAIVILGAKLTIRKIITVGDIQAFINYIKSLNQYLSQVTNATSVIQEIFSSAQRVFEFLSYEEEKPDIDIVEIPEKIKGNVKFENVCFGYKKNELVIQNLSFEVKAGQKIAIVGATGSGKTTIVKLLMRFYELNSGKIYIDGIDINKLKKSELRKLFAMVLQDAWICSGTIAENIRYSLTCATDEDVVNAAKSAFIHNFINQLSDGYNTFLNDEVNNLSQGQKQLITIARAMIADAKILILDEATSSIDTKTEILVQKAMDNLMRLKTSFVIAHRLSTVKNADVIFVMSKGKIVEVGKHDSLIMRKGIYYDMYNSQFEV